MTAPTTAEVRRLIGEANTALAESIATDDGKGPASFAGSIVLTKVALPLAEERDAAVAERDRLAAVAVHVEGLRAAQQARAEAAERAAEEMRAALVAIIETGPECQHCAEFREGNYEDSERPRERRPITHETTLWRLPVYLCAEHAPDRDASYRKAESKGSGKQPDVVPYVEAEPIRIAREALARRLAEEQKP